MSQVLYEPKSYAQKQSIGQLQSQSTAPGANCAWFKHYQDTNADGVRFAGAEGVR